jgi:propionate catabolism operon transcriptional regulator
MPGGVAQRVGARPGSDTLQQLLDDHGGNREQVAQRLGVSRTTLWRWLRSTTG